MGSYRVHSLVMPGAYKINFETHEDSRGSFTEFFNGKAIFQSIPEGLRSPYPEMQFCQANISHSNKGVVRGLHIQRRNPQGKYLIALTGKIFDVAVDLRADSPTFRRAFWVELNHPNEAVYWPPGTAHGMAAMTDCSLLYLCTSPYDRESDGGIYYADPELAIPWPVNPEIVSDKDFGLPRLEDWLKKA